MIEQQNEKERRHSWFNAMKHYLRQKKMKDMLSENGLFKHVTPVVENPIKAVEVVSICFDQLNREDRWSKTEFQSQDPIAHITVQDPNDSEDVVLPAIISYPNAPERRIHVEDEDEEVKRSYEKVFDLRFIEEWMPGFRSLFSKTLLHSFRSFVSPCRKEAAVLFYPT